jgi:hypothetical protein
MSAESEGDVAAELGTNYNLGKTITSVCPAWQCPHHTATVTFDTHCSRLSCSDQTRLVTLTGAFSHHVLHRVVR